MIDPSTLLFIIPNWRTVMVENVNHHVSMEAWPTNNQG